MTTTVKITELTDIGANLASSTVVPVVNMAGTPITQKTNIGNIANLILEGAGGDYSEASVALLAQTVSNAAQPNITSVGTLTTLTVSGNTNLGGVANVKITGGTSGYVLSTDGAGNLSWTAGGGGGSYGNSNVAAYLPTYTGNVGANWVIASYFMGNAHNLTYLPGANVNGAVAYATTANSVAGANVSGAVTYATTANSVAAANVSGLGNLALLNKDGNASNVLHGDGSWSADTTTYGNSNVAAYLPTNTSNVGAGYVFAQNVDVSGRVLTANLLSNTALGINVSGNTTTFQANGDILLNSGARFTDSAFLAGANSTAILGNNAGTIKFFAQHDGAYVQTSNGSNTFITVFQPDGDLAIPGNTIYPSGSQVGEIAGNSSMGIAASTNHDIVFETDDGNSGYQWVMQTNGNMVIPGQGVIKYSNGLTYGSQFTGNITFSGSNISSSYNTDIIIDSPDNSNVKISANSSTWNFQGNGRLTYPDGTAMFQDAGLFHITSGNLVISMGPNANAVSQWKFNGDGGFIPPTLTVDLHNGGNQTAQTLQFGDASQQAIITGPAPAVDTNAQRLIIQGQRGNGTGEGGDVYVWAGDATNNGGDIKIYAGDADVSGYGGYINLDAGSGVDGGGQLTLTGGYSSGGQGGQITITPGYSGNANGALLSLNGGQGSGDGGAVNITAGYGGANGGQVTITGGQSALGLAGYGNVVVQAGASGWTFDNGGNLTVPGEGIIQSINDTVILRSVDANSNIYSARLGTNGGLYFETTAYPTGWLSLTNNSGNANITAATGTAGGAGKHIIINAGDADQSDFYTSAGGNINITGGLGASNDGGGGGPGGSINITAGNSSDPAGVAGSINITTGSNVWTFNNAGQITLPGNQGYIGPSVAGNPDLRIYNDQSSGFVRLGWQPGAVLTPGANVASNITLDSTGFTVTTTDDSFTTTNDWTFGTGGNLAVPGSINFSNSTLAYMTTGANNYINLNNDGGMDLSCNTEVKITTNYGDAPNRAYSYFYANGNFATGSIVSSGNISGGNISTTGNISGNTNGYTIGYLNIPQVAASNTTLALGDAGKHYYSTTAGNFTLTVPNNSSAAFATGTAISIVVQAAGNILVNAASGVTLYMAGNSTAANRVVGGYGMATLMKVATDTWFINGTGVS